MGSRIATHSTWRVIGKPWHPPTIRVDADCPSKGVHVDGPLTKRGREGSLPGCDIDRRREALFARLLSLHNRTYPHAAP